MAEPIDDGLAGLEQWIAAAAGDLVELLAKMNSNELRFAEKAFGLIAPLADNQEEAGVRFWRILESLILHQRVVSRKREIAALEALYHAGADE